jgi:hypothetical protein
VTRRQILIMALMTAGAAQAEISVYDNMVQARYVHCAFYKNYEIDPATGDLLMVEGHSQSLTHFQAIGNGRARQISTRIAGARDIRVIPTAKYLHFVDHVAGMYVLTTVTMCLERDPRSAHCVRYGAMQSRNFDTRVLSDPDAVYEALKDNSDPGFCDHSFFHIQEASR